MYLLRKVQKSYFHQPKLCSYLKMMSMSSLYQFVMWFSGSHLFPIIYPGLGKPFLHFVKPYLQHCKEQYCIETWNVRSMNQGKFSSVLFSHSVVSDSLWPHELQHTRPPCPSPTPEFTQTRIRWVGDAIQSSHPLSSPFLPAPNPSQHQSLFQWVNSFHEVAIPGLRCKEGWQWSFLASTLGRITKC